MTIDRMFEDWLAPGGHSPWFLRVGLPLVQGEEQSLAAQLAGVADAGAVTVVASWADAARILDAAERDSLDWNAREEAREALWMQASEQHTESALLDALRALHERFRGPLDASAGAAARRLAIADPRFVADAAGAAQLALQHAALATLAGARGVQPFAAVLEVFAGGRWPLVALNGRFHIY